MKQVVRIPPRPSSLRAGWQTKVCSLRHQGRSLKCPDTERASGAAGVHTTERGQGRVDRVAVHQSSLPGSSPTPSPLCLASPGSCLLLFFSPTEKLEITYFSTQEPNT